MKRTATLLAILLVIAGCNEHEGHEHEGHESEAHESEAHESEGHDEEECSGDHGQELKVDPGIAEVLIEEHIVTAGHGGQHLELACEVEVSPNAMLRVISLVDGRVGELRVTAGAKVEAGDALGSVTSADLGAVRLRHDVAHQNATLAKRRREQVHQVHEDLQALVATVEAGDAASSDLLPDLVVGKWKGRLLGARNRLVAAQESAARARATAQDLRTLAQGLSTGEWERPRKSLRPGATGALLSAAHTEQDHAWTAYKREKELAKEGLAPKRRLDAAHRDLAVARAALGGSIQQALLDAADMETRADEAVATAGAAFRAVVEEISLDTQTHQLEESKLDAEATAGLEVTHRELADFGVDPDEIAADCAGRGDRGASCWTFQAPGAGVVLEQHVAPGQSVVRGSLLYTIADPESLWIQCHVYDQDLPRVSVGLPLPAEVRSRAWPGETFPGSLDYVAVTTDPASRTTMARITLTTPDKRLRPGAFVRARVRLPAAPGLVQVPRRAVVRVEGQDAVFVKTSSGTWMHREVTVDRVEGDLAWIRSGLAAGEVCAARGGHSLDAALRWSEVGAAHGHKH